MLQIQKYILENRRDLRKNLRKTVTSPIKETIHEFEKTLRTYYIFSKKHILNRRMYTFYSVIFFYLFIFRDFAWADETTSAAASTTINGAIDILNGVISIVALISQPLVMFIGWLLSPDWTFGDIIGLRPALHTIWIMVANFVYVIFAFMLVVIAFMNIFGDSKGQFAMKQSLPRLVVGILIVPFTWFIVSAVLSVSNILTASVLSLSYDTIAKNPAGSAILDKAIIPKSINIDLTDDSDWETGLGEEGMTAEDTAAAQAETHAAATGEGGDYHNVDCAKEPDKCIKFSDLMGNGNGAYNVLTIYAYGIFKIDKLKELSDKQTLTSVKKVGDIFKKLTFGVIFALVFGILIIAIAFALFSRMTMLWLFAMFSPVFALVYFFHGKGGKMMEDINKHISITKFISLAMVPVYVSAALAFGLTFLSLAMSANYEGSEFISLTNSGNTDENGDQTISFGQGNGKFDLTIMGNYDSGTNGVFGDVMDVTKGMISNIIISFLALVILWMAVMAALKANEITGKAIAPIAEFGNSIGKLAMDAPKYIPLKVPGTGKGMSMEGLKSFGGNIERAISNAASVEGSKLGTKFGESLASTMGYHTQDWYNKSRENLDKQPTNVKSEQAAWISNGIKMMDIKDLPDLAKDKQKQEMLMQHIEKLTINPDAKKKILEDIKIGTLDSIVKGFHELDIALDGYLGEKGIHDLKTATGLNKLFKNNNEGKVDADNEIKINKPKIAAANGLVKDTQNVTVVIEGTDKNNKPAKQTVKFELSSFKDENNRMVPDDKKREMIEAKLTEEGIELDKTVVDSIAAKIV
ncbi:MAG: hypothetical protein PHS92_00400 [Candidatus Gracilibacteria bacterium]|nr:hypothetical protein [Candidatus Gracilibacteria bacterium]